MKQTDLVRVPVRFNLKNPEHAKILQILNDLNKTYHTSKSAFIIEAIEYYIKKSPEDSITNAGKAAADARAREFVTGAEVDEKIEMYDKTLKSWLFDWQNSISQGVTRSSPAILPLSFQAGEDKSPDNEVDLTKYPDIMQDINAWSEDD